MNEHRYRIGIVGLGRIGRALLKLMWKRVSETPALVVWAHDTLPDWETPPVDAVVNAGPWQANRAMIEYAVAHDCSYFDFSEDTATTEMATAATERSDRLFVPHCGLAPGVICIMAHDLWTAHRGAALDLYCGAIPVERPNNAMKHAVTWSADGLAHEYTTPATGIVGGRICSLPPLGEYDMPGGVMECFTTAGGLGTLASTMLGRVDTLRYRTIRHWGHHRWLSDLRRHGAGEAEIRDAMLAQPSDPDAEDVVVIRITTGGGVFADWVIKPHAGLSAIQYATASGMACMLDLAARGELGTQGFVRQESVSMKKLMSSPFADAYRDAAVS